MRPLIFILCLILSPLWGEEDSLEEFFGSRFALVPPSKEDEKAVFQAIQTFFERLKTKNVTEAYFISTSPQFQGTLSFKQFKLFIQRLLELKYQEDLKKGSISFSGSEKDKALYTILLKGNKKDEKFYVELSLEKQDEEWKIVNIKIYQIYSVTHKLPLNNCLWKKYDTDYPA